jgi:hypothetical protein
MSWLIAFTKALLRRRTPSNPDYPNPKRLAGLMRAFDHVATGKEQIHAINEEFGKVNATEEIEALKQIGINDEPTITYVERPKERPRNLNPIDMACYFRDSIRLRKYNEEWIKKNIR